MKPETRKAMRAWLLELDAKERPDAEGFTVEEYAKAEGVSVNTAARYVKRLATSGHLARVGTRRVLRSNGSPIRVQVYDAVTKRR